MPDPLSDELPIDPDAAIARLAALARESPDLFAEVVVSLAMRALEHRAMAQQRAAKGAAGLKAEADRRRSIAIEAAREVLAARPGLKSYRSLARLVARNPDVEWSAETIRRELSSSGLLG